MCSSDLFPSHDSIKTKEELYTHQSRVYGFAPPIFTEDFVSSERIIDGSKLEKLGFEYEYKNPMEFVG